MAVEPKRGCGYRRVGGVYLVGGGLSAPCDRMPFPLERCRTCGGGVKFTRGHAWLQPDFFLPIHDPTHCRDAGPCPICGPTTIGSTEFGPHLLLWVGRGHYSPESYLDESRRLGVSRRLSAVPKGLVLGQTWVLLTHLDAVPAADSLCTDCGAPKDRHLTDVVTDVTVPDLAALAVLPPPPVGALARVTSTGDVWTLKSPPPSPDPDGVTVVAVNTDLSWQRWLPVRCAAYRPPRATPGIFCAFVPRAVELVLRKSDATPERVERERKRGVTVVAVPDDDPDHDPQGGEGDDDSQPELPGAQPGVPA